MRLNLQSESRSIWPLLLGRIEVVGGTLYNGGIPPTDVWIKHSFFSDAKPLTAATNAAVRPGRRVCLTFNGLKWNAMTNMPGDMAHTSVTDFFTLPKSGRVSESTNVWFRHASKWSGGNTAAILC